MNGIDIIIILEQKSVSVKVWNDTDRKVVTKTIGREKKGEGKGKRKKERERGRWGKRKKKTENTHKTITKSQ